MTTNIYILRLEGGRYYIGKSENVLKRYQQHLNGSGSSWTKKYKPVSLERTIENASHFEEDKITKEYMYKHGIDNVRGGSYIEVELSAFHKAALQMEIWGAKDLCTQCGRAGHFVSKCYAKTDVNGNNLEQEESSSDEEGELEWECDYCDRTFTTAFGCGVHEKSCKEKNVSSRRGGGGRNACYRCGNTGHTSSECYASRHVNGYSLY